MRIFIIRSVRLLLKHAHLCLICIVINMSGNSKYVENMNNFGKGGDE